MKAADIVSRNLNSRIGLASVGAQVIISTLGLWFDVIGADENHRLGAVSQLIFPIAERHHPSIMKWASSIPQY